MDVYKAGNILVNRRFAPFRRVVVVEVLSSGISSFDWIKTSSSSVYGFSISLNSEGWRKV